MKVFISWSGSNSISHKIATILRDWIPKVLQRTECFLSSQDIGAGTIANNELFSHLEKSRLGIVCLTRANARSPWINFEAGAIAKVVGEARVCPLLVDISPGDVKGPLSTFQMKELSRSGVKDIIAIRIRRDRSIIEVSVLVRSPIPSAPLRFVVQPLQRYERP
jgi:TIR domain